MNIPQLPYCRYMTITQMAKHQLEDSFTHKAVRVAGRITRQWYEGKVAFVEVEEIFTSDDQNVENLCLRVNVDACKSKQIETGQVYEFLGDIEQLKD